MAWQAEQGWRAGGNFLPSTASNQLELWMDPLDWGTIERELSYAARMGFNSMRVFLHDLPYQHEGLGFLNKIDRFLRVSHKLNIKPILVLLDSCWDPLPIYEATQPPPRPFIHNSRWVQSPGRHVLENQTRFELEIKPYIQDIVSRFGSDPRVLMLDLWNEPFSGDGSPYGSEGTRVPAASDAFGTELDPTVKQQLVRQYLPMVFAWARQAQHAGNINNKTTVPLTTGLYGGISYKSFFPEWRYLLETAVDVITFHNYGSQDNVQQEIDDLKQYGRPIICTEYMARTANVSTFDPILGVLHANNVGAFHWGWVTGRSQTRFPWSSWFVEITKEPIIWHHDVLWDDGTPFSQQEYQYIKSILSKKNKTPLTDAHTDSITIPN